MKFLTDILAVFRTPTAAQIAKRQLEEAERSILKHRDAAEYSDAMVIYLETKISRLKGEDKAKSISGFDVADLQILRKA